MTARPFTSLTLTWTAALALYACIPAGDGVEPPNDVSYFPVGLAVDPSAEWLYVVNSDFDLQYNQGTIQSLALDRIREIARRPCSEDADCTGAPLGGEQRCDVTPNDKNDQNPSFFCVDVAGEYADLPCGPFAENIPAVRAVSPGRCGPVALTDPADGRGPVQGDVVRISAFATDLLIVPRPVAGPDGEEPSREEARLFIPVRGDSSLHFIDTKAGKFTCGQDDKDRCSADYRVTQGETSDPSAPLETPVEPFDIAATPDGRHLVISHQAHGKASAFVNDWSLREDGRVAPPRLVSIADNMPTAMIGIANVPRPRLLDFLPTKNYQSGFLVTFRNDASVHLLRFFEEGTGLGGAGGAAHEVDQPLLFDVARTVITTNSVGTDSRGVAIDDSARRAAEAACDDDVVCLEQAIRVPFDVYVANRSPNSLLVGRSDAPDAVVGTSDLPSFHDNIPLTTGPSRVVIGHIVDKTGAWVRRIFVLCFDSAVIYVYDPERRVVEWEIFTGRGPHSLAFMDADSQLPYAFVGHFTDSYVGVISLDQRHPETFGSTLAILGTPTPPRASR